MYQLGKKCVPNLLRKRTGMGKGPQAKKVRKSEALAKRRREKNEALQDTAMTVRVVLVRVFFVMV